MITLFSLFFQDTKKLWSHLSKTIIWGIILIFILQQEKKDNPRNYNPSNQHLIPFTAQRTCIGSFLFSFMFIWLKLTGFENSLLFFVSLRVFSNPDAEHGGGKSISPNFVSALRPCYLLPLNSGVFRGSPGQELKTQYGAAMHTELNLCPIHLSPVDTEPNSNTSN